MFTNISQIKKIKAAAVLFALLSVMVFAVNVQTVQAATVEVIEKMEINDTAQDVTPVADQRLYEGVSTAVPRLEQSEPGVASSKYLSTYVERNLSSGSMASVATRCPAFVSWEDWWGGIRVHAYVDFRPSDLCDGRHVKRAYVRLIRQCGPYYDTGRIYTYTASSASDTRLYSVSAWIFDSIIWGCVTSTKYGYEYF